MSNCTLRAITRATRFPANAKDYAWELTQRLDTERRASRERMEAARDAFDTRADRVAEILRTYRFSRYDYRTFTREGICLQASLLIENPNDPKDRYIVTCSIENGPEEEWTVQCPSFKKDLGPLFIASAKARRRANEAALRSGRAVN